MVTAALTSSDGLAGMLCGTGAEAEPWRLAFVHACLATLGHRNVERQLEHTLQQLQNSTNHGECRLQLEQLQLLCCAAEQVGS